MNFKFLVVEDDDLAKINLEMFLREQGEVVHASNSADALQAIKNHRFDIAFIDIDLERDFVGLELITPIVKSGSYAVVLSGREDDDTIEKAYDNGCFDFLSKPFTRNAFDIVLKKFSLMHSSKFIADFFKTKFITNDNDMVEQLKVLNEVVVCDRPIYLRGASGTGKTYIAKLIHDLIFKDDSRFVHLNCSEVPENLLESELFGHEKGAFTGATSKKEGKLSLAHGGTLFLDEVATMPMPVQKKLLRVIEEKSFTPLGSTKKEISNFRLISATCNDLERMVKDGEFREDLYYRLEGFNIQLKDLTKRKSDILLLVRHFLALRERRIVISPDAMGLLKNYSWPGNVRELKKTIDILVTKERGVIGVDDLPDKFKSRTEIKKYVVDDDVIYYVEKYGLKSYVEDIENKIVAKFIEIKSGKIREAFNALKISSSSFYRIKDRIDSEE